MFQLVRNGDIRLDHTPVERADSARFLEESCFVPQLLDNPVHHFGRHVPAAVKDFFPPFGGDFLRQKSKKRW